MQTFSVLRPNGRLGHKEILGGMQMKFTRNHKFRTPQSLICYLCNLPEPALLEAAVNFIEIARLDALPEVRFEGDFTREDARDLALHIHKIGCLKNV